MSRRLSFFLWGSGLFSFFILFSYLVHKDVFTQFDFNSTVRLQDNISTRFDDLFSIFSDIGKFEIITVILALIFVVTRKLMAGIVAFSLYIGFHVIELYGKIFVHHLPPPEFMLRTKHLIDFPQFHVRTENSYPSGHSGRTMFISTILVILILQSKRIPSIAKLILIGMIILFDIIMLVSRPYLGEHWASDVIGGGLLGLSLGLLTGAFLAAKGKSMKLFPKLPKYKLEIKKVE